MKRSLPDWLKDEIDAENKPSNEQPPNHRYKLRNRLKSINENTIDADLNSAEKEPAELKPKYQPRPYIDYKGKVEYYTKMQDIAFSCDNLLQWVDKQTADIVPIAFDMEWPFSFQTGPGKSAVIQLCADINLCYVFHINHLKKLPVALLQLLYHPKVRLHGVNIKCDFRKLERDFPETNAQKMIDQCVDLSNWCNKVINSSGRWSMERLVMRICKLRINKDGKVRRSKWDVQPLSKEQQIYAAIDVYISQVIYLELERLEKVDAEQTKKFVEEYGEKALTAVNQLK